MSEPSDTMVGPQPVHELGDPVGVEPRDLYAGPARSASEIDAARELHTRVYVELGAIIRTDDQPFDDGWMDQREWLVVADRRNVVGTTSLIAPTHTLPTLAAFGIDPLGDARIGPAWRERRVVEVSTLVRDRRARSAVPTAPLLYRVMWMSAARRRDHDVWVMSMTVERLRRLALLFPVPFEQIGGVVEYYGHASVACALDLRLARAAMEVRDAATLQWLDGRSDDCGLVTTALGPGEQ